MKTFLYLLGWLVGGVALCGGLGSLTTTPSGATTLLVFSGVVFAVMLLAWVLPKMSEASTSGAYGNAVSEGGENVVPFEALEHVEAANKDREADVSTRKGETILGSLSHGGYMTATDVERQSGTYILGVQGVGKSSLLENIIHQDICKGFAVIVLDPHGDLIDHALAQMPEERLRDVSLLSIEDTAYPFGVNLFSVTAGANEIEQSQAVDRVLHVFEKCFPETSRMLLEKYLGNIAPVFFAHADVGYGMTDIPTFLQGEAFREGLIKKSRLFIRRFWESDYANMSPSVRRSETASLATRLNRFMRSPIVGNIIGQSKTTIDFRKAIENKEIIFVRLPIKTLKDDATLIGTMLVAQIHAAIFSFADTKLEDRPGFSLFVDEFQHFATSDFAEMFTEGRKFGSRVAVAHQFRGQLPDYLTSATLTARTIVTFQTTQEDAPKMAQLYPLEVKPTDADIDPAPVEYMLSYVGDHQVLNTFIRWYLRPVAGQGKQIEVTTYEPQVGVAREFALNAAGMYVNRRDKPKVTNPKDALNHLLYEAQKKHNANLPIPYDIIFGFSNCGNGYYWIFDALDSGGKANITAGDIRIPIERIKSVPKKGQEQLEHFIYHLRYCMDALVVRPVYKSIKEPTTSQIAQRVLSLSRGQALVKVGSSAQEITTLDIPESVRPSVFEERRRVVVEQTRAKYCRPAKEVEREIEKRLGIIEDVVSDGAVALDVEEQKPDTGKPSDNGDGGGEKKRKRIVEVDDE